MNSSNLFVVQNGERVLLFREGDRFVDRDGSITWNSAQLIDTIRRPPHLFSNNVLTRPLVQEYLLPVAAAVVGRSEAAYWAQLREAFHLMEMKLPPVVLRHEYTLLDKTVEKHMDKFGLSLEDVMYRFDEKKAEWLKEQDELDLDGLFAETKQRLRELYVPVVRQVATLDPGLKSLGHTNMNKLIEQVEFLEKRAKHTLVSRNKAALRQMNRIVQNLHPLNRPQERVFNVVHYINKFGDGFLHELLRLDTVPGEYHYILRLN